LLESKRSTAILKKKRNDQNPIRDGIKNTLKNARLKGQGLTALALVCKVDREQKSLNIF